MLAEPESNPPRRRPPYGIYAYTAREWDPEINLYYYRARFYDPKVGRFVSEDPKALDHDHTLRKGRAPRYEYARNSPILYVDPDGRSWRKVPRKAWKWLTCSWRQWQCNQAVRKYCKCQHPYDAPKKGRPLGGTKYMSCVNDGTNKCCAIFFMICKGGTTKLLAEGLVGKPQCPDDPAFDPYRYDD